MKKYLFFIFILLLGFTIVTPAEASSVVLKPNVVGVEAGKTFTLPVVVDGEGQAQYTVKFAINFPPNLLEVTSFSFSGNWFALSQSGYDSIDNKLGELIKTGGFPGGFSGPVSFGTITFRSKGAGEANIIVGSQSFVLDAQNQNTMGSRPQVRVVAAPTKASVPKVSAIKPLPDLPPVEENISDISPAPEPIPDLPTAGDNIFDISQVPEQKTSSFPVPSLIFSLIVVALLGIIGWVMFTKRRRSSAQKIINDKDLTN